MQRRIDDPTSSDRIDSIVSYTIDTLLDTSVRYFGSLSGGARATIGLSTSTRYRTGSSGGPIRRAS